MESRGELVVERADGVWVLILRGEHDLSTSPTLGLELEAVFAHGTTVVVDLTEATFIDSSVAGALMRAWEAAQSKEASAVVLSAPQGSPPRRLLDMVGITRVVPTFETRALAFDHLATGEV